MLLVPRFLKAFGACLLGAILFIQAPRSLQRQVDQDTWKIEVLDERTKNLEALHIESSLARIEATVESDHKLIWAMAVVVLTGSLETLVRYINNRRKSSDSTPSDSD